MANPVTDYGYFHKHLTVTGAVTEVTGILHTLTINRPSATAGAIMTLYDSVDDTGAVIAIITLDKAVYVVPTTLQYDVNLTNGLYAVFSDEVNAGADVTFSYT